VAEGSTLYSAEILDHAKRPCGADELDAPTHHARVDNPLCGDRLDLELEVEASTVLAVGHRVRGCSLCKASASMLARDLVGATLDEARAKARTARRELEALSAGEDTELTVLSSAFAGLAHAPARKQCVALAWDALEQVLADDPR